MALNSLFNQNPKTSIMIIDDTPANLRLLASMLSQEGFKVRPISNGKLALSAIQAALPDLILLDINMPELSGYDVCQQLKADAKTRHIPIIFISALDETLDKIKAFNVGGIDYITKPFHLAEVLVRVKNHLMIQQLQNQLQQTNSKLSKINTDLQSSNQQLKHEIRGRKQVEERLQLTQFAVDHATDAVFWVSQAGQVTYANLAACQSLGYTHENLLTRFIHEIDPNYPPEIWASHWNQSKSRSMTVESYHYKKDGTNFPVEVAFTYLEFDDKAYNFILARDVTWRRWAAEALKNSEEGFRLIANRLQNELALAQDIQKSLLPASVPKWKDLDVICYTQPAREVGGDFYTYHAITHKRVLVSKHILAIGDVSGKGVSAALLMAAGLSLFDASLALKLSPAERLSHLDKVFMPYTKSQGQNCALCYVEIIGVNTTRPVLKIVNAACIPPYIKRVDGTVEWPDAYGFALGQGFGIEHGYQEIGLTLTKGDMIIMTSDGVVEAGDANNQIFGFERLQETIATGPQSSARAMLNHIKRKVATLVGDTEAHDDLTIIVAKI